MEEPGSLATGDRPGGRRWCLRRARMNAEWLLLEDGNEVRGRGPGAGDRVGGSGAGASGREG